MKNDAKAAADAASREPGAEGEPVALGGDSFVFVGAGAPADAAHEGWVEIETLSAGETRASVSESPPTETITMNFEQIHLSPEPQEAAFDLL